MRIVAAQPSIVFRNMKGMLEYARVFDLATECLQGGHSLTESVDEHAGAKNQPKVIVSRSSDS